MARQHERLRVPDGWGGQAKALIQQLERIHDDIYNRLGEAGIPEEVQEFMDTTTETLGTIAGDISDINGDISDINGDISDINGDISTINGSITTLGTTDTTIANAVAIVATNNTHAAVTSGQYVLILKHGTLTPGLYKASTAISKNATLSSSNVTAVSGGGLNSLLSYIDTGTVETINNPITFDSTYVTTADSSSVMYKIGKLRILNAVVAIKDAASGWQTVGTVASAHCPKSDVRELGMVEASTPVIKMFRLSTAGSFRILSRTINTFRFSATYVV